MSDEVREGCGRVLDLARRGLEAKALEECRTLAARHPGRAEPRLQLGVLLLHARQHAEAEAALRECLLLAPGHEPALTLLGDLLFDRREMKGALECFEKLSLLRPDDGRLWTHIAVSCFAVGRFDDAEAAARRARTLEPRSAHAWLILARALAVQGRRAEAFGAVKECLGLDPGLADAHDLSGRLHAEGGAWSLAANCFREALACGAGGMTASRLGDTLMQIGDVTGATAAYRDAEARDAARAAAHASRALFALHGGDGVPSGQVLAAHREWAAKYAATPVPGITRLRDPDRRLRVGYVSPRFHRSSVAFLLLPVLEGHDAKEFEFFCYAQQDADDEVTARIRARCAGWRDTRGMDDEALASAIDEDAIDIVVDLAGHTPDSRLRALARKPAPIALTWLDYFDTTGCAAIDAIVTDPVHSPPGDTQQFVERRLRIEPLRYCYCPPPDAPDPVPPPALSAPAVTYCAFHRFAKIGPSVLAAWAHLLERDPAARLVIKNDALNDEGEREFHRERLARAGLPMDRVELRGASAHREMLAEYGETDIALDAFPYNGGITTLEALWMGRPVIAVEGDTMISRQSAAILRAAGLGELVAPDAEGMVAVAAGLAADRRRLAEICAGLRPRLAASAVCDAPGFVRKLEAAYREAWHAWCAGRPVGEDR